MRFAAFTAVFALSGALAGSALGALSLLEARAERQPRVLLDGFEPPARSELVAWLERRKERLGEREAYLKLPDGYEVARFDELGIRLDVARTLQALERAELPETYLHKLYRGFRPDPDSARVESVFDFDPEQAAQVIEGFRSRLRRESENARLDVKNHRNVPDVSGRDLDLEATLAAIAGGERGDEPVFEVGVQSVRAAVTAEMLSALDVSKVLASYETDFTHRAGPRAINIKRAAELLDGSVIGPGEVFSFNQTVGARTLERGFVNAPVIVQDELEPGLGGGVCQVASTVHAAAVFGEMEVVRRRSHSRPSGYAPLGLDATVIYGEVDLKLKNPYDSPLLLHVYLPTKTSLKVEFLGHDTPGKVDHTGLVEKSEDFYRRVVVKDELPSGELKRHQKGIKGYDVLSAVKLTRFDGTTSVHYYKSRYYPVPEIYWIGPGTDLAILPELPAGASHVELGEKTSALGSDDAIDPEHERL